MNYLLATAISFTVSIILGYFVVKKMKKSNINQTVRDDIPEAHLSKNGTPTMGGMIFIIPITFLIILRFIFVKGTIDPGTILFLFVFLGFAIIGFFDDFFKVVQKRNEGLSAKTKMLFQILLFVIIAFALINNNFDTTVTFHLFNKVIDFGIFYYVIIFFMLVGGSNATNLTDGIDGLLTSNAIITYLFFGIVFFSLSNINLVYICSFIIGALLAFLYFNKNKAKIFMGDFGSLAIGSGVAILAIIGKVETLFLWFGFIYIIETLSVIIQVAYFKYTKKKYGQGRRIFKMSPIHHHFEKSGYSENKIVLLFCSVSFIICTLGLLVYFY